MKKFKKISALLLISLLTSCEIPEEYQDNPWYGFVSELLEQMFEESISDVDKESITDIVSETLSSLESESAKESEYVSEKESSKESESTKESVSEKESESTSEKESESVSEKESTKESESESISEEESESTSEQSNFDDHWSNSDFGNYYAGIDFTQNGTTLLASLQTLNNKKYKNHLTYSNLWSYFNKTDYDPNNKSKYIAFYRGTSASKGDMNKEHVWPKSHGGQLVEGDIHVIRPTLSSDNSSRGNSFYVEGMNSSSQGWDPKTAGMKEYYRGIAARIIFYCCVANSNLSLVDVSYSSTSNSNRDNKMGKLSDLLKWNLAYDIDDSELRRNNGAEDVQGNRNPFIDNRDLACKIWGNTNSTTKGICSIGSK